MRVVNAFEARVLRLVYAMFGKLPPLSLRLFARPGGRPPAVAGSPVRFGREALHLLKQALSKGMARYLAQRGGWRVASHLRGDGTARGRLWDRTPPEQLGLRFTGQTLSFLAWLASESSDPPWRSTAELSLGDRLVLFRAAETFLPGIASSDWNYSPPGWVRELAAEPAFAGHALLQLMHPNLRVSAGIAAAPDWDVWFDDPGAAILEVFQCPLADRWLFLERAKMRSRNTDFLCRAGTAQELVLSTLAGAIDRRGRYDLGRFLLIAAGELLEDSSRVAAWAQSLRVRKLRLMERAKLYNASLALVRHLLRAERWHQASRNVGYFDEGYAAAQLSQQDWEATGAALAVRRARALLEPLHVARGAVGEDP